MLISSTSYTSAFNSTPAMAVGRASAVQNNLDNNVNASQTSTQQESPENLASQSNQRVSYSPGLPTTSELERNNANKEGAQEEFNNALSSEARQRQTAEAEVKQVIDQLKARDTEVRAHEMAHLMAAGQYARGMSFSYQTGPDGKRYAIGGEVGIDTSPIAGDPQATIDKAMVVQRAALAPAEPSAQDRKVAQQATQMMANARAELMQQQLSESDVAGTTDNEEEQDSLSLAEASSSERGSQITPNNQNDSIFVNQQTASTIENSLRVTNADNNLSASLFTERNQFDLRMQFSR